MHLLRTTDRARAKKRGRRNLESFTRCGRGGESLRPSRLFGKKRATRGSPLELRSRFDVFARHPLQPRDDVALARRHVEGEKRDFLHTRIAVASEVIGTDRVRVRTDGELDLRAAASVRAEEILDAPDLRLGLIGRQIESDPPIAVSSDAFQRRAAFAAEPDRHALAVGGLWEAAHPGELYVLPIVRAAFLGPELPKHLDVFARALSALFPGNADRLELFSEPADADAEHHATVAQAVGG